MSERSGSGADDVPPTVALSESQLIPTVPLGQAAIPTVLVDGPPEPASRTPATPPSRARLAWADGGHPLGGRYLLVRLLGSGGMGSVYLADDLLLGHRVAIKTLWAESAFEESEVARFRREVAMAHAVSHPNVARTYDLGEQSGTTYLTMEHLEGETLLARLKRVGRLSSSEVRELAVPLCRGLGAAHRAGVVHRDLKPANVMLVPDARQLVILDFGIAGWTHGADHEHLPAERSARGPVDRRDLTSAGFGTPAFMAPEQWERAPGDPRTDIYALGVILFLCLTGQQPFVASSAEELGRLHREAPIPDPRRLAPEIDADLADLVCRCLAKRPQERPRSVDEILERLEMPAERRRYLGQMLGVCAICALLLTALWAGLRATAEGAILAELRPAIARLAELAAHDLDPADLDSLRAISDVDGEAFRRVAAAVERRLADAGDAVDIYVLRPTGEAHELRFVFDPEPRDRDLDGDGKIRPGSDEVGAPPGLRFDARPYPVMAEVLASGVPAAEREFSRDEWGDYVLSGFAVLETGRPGERLLVGVDATHERLSAFEALLRATVATAWAAIVATLAFLLHPRRRLRRARSLEPARV